MVPSDARKAIAYFAVYGQWPIMSERLERLVSNVSGEDMELIIENNKIARVQP